jgi:hypothetical protein
VSSDGYTDWIHPRERQKEAVLMTTEPQYRVIADRDSTPDLVSADAAPGDRLVYDVIDEDRWSLVRIERPVPAIEQAAFESSTPRGFGITEFHYRDYDDGGQQRFSVQASSLATERKVWIGPGNERAHLNEAEACRVRDALNAFLGDGPSENARPHLCTPGCTDDSCPVEPLTDAEVVELRSILVARGLTVATAAPEQ